MKRWAWRKHPIARGVPFEYFYYHVARNMFDWKRFLIKLALHMPVRFPRCAKWQTLGHVGYTI